MKLYYASSACSLSPHIVALEAGLTLVRWAGFVKVELSAFASVQAF